MMRNPSSALSRSDLALALASLRGWLVGVGLFSGVINLLALTGSLFMLQIYDRVLPSHSGVTLVALMIVAIGLYAVQGALDVIRSRLLVRMGSRLDEKLGARIYAIVLQLPLRMGRNGDGLQPVRDLDTMRSFLSGQGPSALLDLPWIPIYLAFVFMLHPWLGWLATAGALVLIGLTLITELQSRKPAREVMIEANKRHALSSAGRRNAEVLHAMGFGGRLQARWLTANASHLAAHQRASDVTGGLGAISKVFRGFLQSAILALGAWLTIKGEVSAGAIIASSIASARALAPIETAIGNWKFFMAARESRKRLIKLLDALPPSHAPMSLPSPARELILEGLTAGAPGSLLPIMQNVSFKLEAGQGLGVIGPSAAGKSTLVRAMIGVWPSMRGIVRIDGAALDQWSPAELGQHIGYLPQDIELFDGTVAENISRFAHDPDPQTIIAAAQAANIHEMILHLADGYGTRLGEDGTSLSAGQRQRIALARALYGDPFLVVLDEPNSNLDAEGEAALTHAIHGIRNRGGIVVVVAHRPSAIAAVDILAVMAGGLVQAFGPKDEVLAKTVQRAGSGLHQGGLSVVAEPAK
ncbi:type I secretion system permease/ATPase [Phyllobacterium salinisoli]|uniref:Type I secretion system permease/ATPase n=1 Tax=Phyllobacterium salinisoli TaxID=1899321 RepID=A0A368JWW5_9HYPH|nr:type I secretion system permease/ATPase [Phyllobacterium salinisoli]RCS21658.1 type I secretion system permease/ATPase [Phyllobacterium salinisoli]